MPANRIAALLVIGLLSCAVCLEAAPAQSPLTAGIVLPDGVHGTRPVQAVTAALRAPLAARGITLGPSVLYLALPDLEAGLRAGTIDLLFVSFHAYAFLRRAGLDVMPLVSWQPRGVAVDEGLIVARAGSTVRTLSDLKGRLLALHRMTATQGTLLPLALLANEGLAIDPLPPVASDKVGTVFTEGPNDVLELLDTGAAQAGTFSASDFSSLSTAVTAQYTVLARTPAAPTGVVAAAPDLSPELRTYLAGVLAKGGAKATPEGQALGGIHFGRQFAPLPPGFAESAARLTPRVDLALQRDPRRQEMRLRARTLVIGRVSDNPKKHYERMAGIVRYVARHLREEGILLGRVYLARNNDEIVSRLRSGKLDWVQETPASAALFHRRTGAEIVLRSWRDGVSEYRSVLVARKDSSVRSLDGLEGRKVAFEDPGSTSAYFVPRGILIRRGYRLARLHSLRESPPQGSVGYVFARQELNVTLLVHRGLVDLGALSSLNWERGHDVPAALKRQLTIVYASRPYPRAVELLRFGLSPRIKERLVQVLLDAPNDPRAAEALRRYRVTRFDRVDDSVEAGIAFVWDLVQAAGNDPD